MGLILKLLDQIWSYEAEWCIFKAKCEKSYNLLVGVKGNLSFNFCILFFLLMHLFAFKLLPHIFQL